MLPQFHCSTLLSLFGFTFYIFVSAPPLFTCDGEGRGGHRLQVHLHKLSNHIYLLYCTIGSLVSCVVFSELPRFSLITFNYYVIAKVYPKNKICILGVLSTNLLGDI